MPYCAICGKNHDAAVNCSDGTGQTLRDMGQRKKATKKSAAELKKLVKQADRWAIRVLLVIVGILILLIILSSIHKTAF